MEQRDKASHGWGERRKGREKNKKRTSKKLGRRKGRRLEELKNEDKKKVWKKWNFFFFLKKLNFQWKVREMRKCSYDKGRLFVRTYGRIREKVEGRRLGCQATVGLYSIYVDLLLNQDLQIQKFIESLINLSIY